MMSTCKRGIAREDPPAKRGRRQKYIYNVASVTGRGISTIKVFRPWMLHHRVAPTTIQFEDRVSSERPTAELVDGHNPHVVHMYIDGVGAVLLGEQTFNYANIASAISADVMVLVQDYMGDGRHEFEEALASFRAENGDPEHYSEPDYSELERKWLMQYMRGMQVNMLGYMEENQRYDPDTLYASVRVLDTSTAVDHHIVAVVTRECPHTGGRSYRLDSLSNPSFWAELTTAPVALY